MINNISGHIRMTEKMLQNTIANNNNTNNGTKSVGKDNSRKLLGLNDYKYLLSKSSPSMNDEEFKQKMKELAQKDAAKGIYGESEFRTLEDSYISVGSPDRKSIINSLLDVLLRRGTPTGVIDVTHSSGSPMSGFRIASYSPEHGWGAISTPTEIARSREINEVYREAWRAARGSASDDIKDNNVSATGYSGDYVYSHSSFNEKG